MAPDDYFEMRFAGADVSPGSIRSKEIAEAIESFEDSIASLVVRDNPDLRKDQVRIGLVSIRGGSIGLQFSPNLERLTVPAMSTMTEAITNRDFGRLPSGTRESLRKIVAFNKRNKCETELSTVNGTVRLQATLTSQTEIPKTSQLAGETTLYGEISRVGGVEPRVQFKTIDEQLVYCDTTRELAKIAANRLYEQVALRGMATWDYETHALETFEIYEISEYRQVSSLEAFSELAELFGPEFDKIADVNQFVSDLRREGGDN